jgi:hypothetical protein
MKVKSRRYFIRSLVRAAGTALMSLFMPSCAGKTIDPDLKISERNYGKTGEQEINSTNNNYLNGFEPAYLKLHRNGAT